ncbi:MAG: 30S ribosomal protein S17 [Acidobacteria bacterium]|nr:30S ribosomal protein S17 [Acidobacteriota bacterium]
MANKIVAPRRQNMEVGQVVSHGGNKTIVVEVSRRVQHPFYKKYVTRRKKFYAHDERNQCQVGDRVRIAETRPLSHLKRWRLVDIMSRPGGSAVPEPIPNPAEEIR